SSPSCSTTARAFRQRRCPPSSRRPPTRWSCTLVNPLQIFPSDLHGPVNVAQRVADTFARVYKRMGVQQHAVVRQAVLDVMADIGIMQDAQDSWAADLPAFGTVQAKLQSYASNPLNAQARFAASAASHISTVFVFNTFRQNGQRLA